MDTDEDCPPDLLPTRKSLLGRLKNWEDNESWREFFNAYWKLIYNFAVQRGLHHPEAEEVVQETVLAVAKGISRFEYDPGGCAFKTWLLTVTRSKIANQFQRRKPQEQASSFSEDSQLTPALAKIPDVAAQEQWEAAWDGEWEKNLMDAVIRRVKRRVSIEQFQMFDLFVLKGWPAADVAKTLRVTLTSVYVTKHRLSRLVKKEARLIEQQGL